MGYTSALICLVVCSHICKPAYSASLPSNQHKARAKPKGFGTAKRAVIIGIDGFGGSHFRNVSKSFTTLRSFFEQGSYTTRARGVYPTSSGPNWSSYLTGLDVMEHGVFSNSWSSKNGDPERDTDYSIPPVTGRGRPQTIFAQVKKKDPNLKTAMMFTWKWLLYYAANNTDIDTWYWGGKDVTCSGTDTYEQCYHRKDLNSVTHAKDNLINNDPVLTFLHLDLLDSAGHNTCWGCPGYYRGLKLVERKIQFLIDSLNQSLSSTGERMLDGTLLVIVSDHGGYRDTHFSTEPFSALVDIPILIRGPGVLKNNSLEATYVSNLDVAVTVLNAIGVEKSEFMRGNVLEQIYK